MKTPSGYRNIEDIRAGDKVLSYNEHTKRLEVQTVAQTFIRKTDRIYTLVYDTGTKLQTTATHPFYIEGKGWVKAADLHIGDDSLLSREVSQLDVYGGARLQNVSYRQSKQGVIVGITVEDRAETVYNFEVSETHTYLVGDADVVVHNADDTYAAEREHISFREKAEDALDFANCMQAGLGQGRCERPFYGNGIIGIIGISTAVTSFTGLYRMMAGVSLREGLERDLRGAAEDYVKAELEKLPPEERSIKELYIRAQAEAHVVRQLMRFDQAPIGHDAITGLPVKVLTAPTDYSKEFNTMVGDASKRMQQLDSPIGLSQLEYLFEAGKQVRQCTNSSNPDCGMLDFKNKIGRPGENLSEGYTNYVVVNGALIRPSDMGNIAYGYLLQNYMPKFSNAGGARLASQIGNGMSQLKPDPRRDQKAISCGFANCINIKGSNK